MKKHFLLATIVLIALACSSISLPIGFTPTPVYTPTPISTPTPIVIFKSPAEMNLQPGDISNLVPADVVSPDDTPLLPDATNQNQRAFKSASEDIFIESDVYLMPTISQYSISAIYDFVVPKRRPGAKRTGSEQPANIGNQSTIIQITASCGPGYVLISKQSNVIVVIIGCGQAVNPSLITQIGRVVDHRLTVSAAVECTKLNLTPEECANAGIHKYSETAEITTGDCFFCTSGCTCTSGPKTANYLVTITNTFTANGSVYVSWVLDNNGCSWTEQRYTRVNSNSYNGTFNNYAGNPGETSIEAITFNIAGYTLASKETFPGGDVCTSHLESTLVK